MNTQAALGLLTNPVITGLWQVADLERDGKMLEQSSAADALLDYIDAGFTAFDMADHYGSAELIAGLARKRAFEQVRAHKRDQAHADNIKLFTKWCPHPSECSFEAVQRGIAARLERLQAERIDLLQLHWWSFDHPGYIDVMDHLSRLQQDGLIQHIGLTNFDTDHLQVLLACGHKIASNQVCLSVLDQRALGDMTQLCLSSDIRLLAYGSLAGGFLSERWLQRAEPDAIADWSKMKYARFINATGGWDKFQCVLSVLLQIAQQYNVSIANVATRWVLQQAAVAGVIIGARITEQQHRDNNRQLLSFELTPNNLQAIAVATSVLDPIQGDCGTEYRRPPYLTASGDLSHHLESLPPVYKKVAVSGRENRWRLSTGSEWEPICGYSRGLRDGRQITISGTTATHGSNRAIGEQDVRAQTVYILDKISASLSSLGANLNDVVRTRIYLTHADDWEQVSRVHGRYFCNVLPANTLIEVSNLVGPYRVEIEADALLPAVASDS